MADSLDQVTAEHRQNALGRLRQAIIDNTRGDLFWIGEILLAELKKETGYEPHQEVMVCCAKDFPRCLHAPASCGYAVQSSECECHVHRAETP